MADTWLVTGGAGNLACQLSRHLVEHCDQLVLTDVAARPVAAVAPSARYERCDLVDAAAVAALLARHRPKVVFHLASLLSGKCELDRGLAWQVNTTATVGLFDAALTSGVQTVVFPSSVASYGGKPDDPLPEDAPQWPEGIYGVTKVACERLGLYYHARHGLDFRCVRLPIIVSRFAPAGAASAYASRAFIEAAQQGRFTFRVRPGTQSSLMYVEDALRALLDLALAPADRLSRRVYNIHSIAPTADEIAACIRHRRPEAELIFDPDPAISALIESWPRRLVDESARRDWGWEPRFDLERIAHVMLEQPSA